MFIFMSSKLTEGKTLNKLCSDIVVCLLKIQDVYWLLQLKENSNLILYCSFSIPRHLYYTNSKVYWMCTWGVQHIQNLCFL